MQSLQTLLFQVAKVRELAERRVAQLNGRIQGLESRLHQLSEENRALASRAPAAQAAVNPQVEPQLLHHAAYSRLQQLECAAVLAMQEAQLCDDHLQPVLECDRAGINHFTQLPVPSSSRFMIATSGDDAQCRSLAGCRAH